MVFYFSGALKLPRGQEISMNLLTGKYRDIILASNRVKNYSRKKLKLSHKKKLNR